MMEVKMETYILDTIHASDHRLSAGGQWVNDERVSCPVCHMWTDSSEPSEIHIAINHLGRQGFTGFLWNSHTLPLFREDLVKVWRSEGFTGFTTKPVRIVGWYKKPNKPLPENIPTYYRIVVTSRVKMLYPRYTGVCSDCGRYQHDFGIPHTVLQYPESMRIDESSWDGSDIFGVHASDILCTDRVARAMLDAGYNKEIVFVRLENYRRWESFDVRRWEAEAYSKYVESFLIRRTEDL